MHRWIKLFSTERLFSINTKCIFCRYSFRILRLSFCEWNLRNKEYIKDWDNARVAAFRGVASVDKKQIILRNRWNCLSQSFQLGLFYNGSQAFRSTIPKPNGVEAVGGNSKWKQKCKLHCNSIVHCSYLINVAMLISENCLGTELPESSFGKKSF